MLVTYFVVFILFLLGMAIGSFLNVVIYRSVHSDSALRGRSYCDKCKKQLTWYDNIPLLSFLILKRKCRYCGVPIPWEYPAVEFLTGLLFVWWFVIGTTFFKLTQEPFLVLQPGFWLIVGILMMVIFFADLSYYIIPDSAVMLLTIVALIYRGVLTSSGVMMRGDFVGSLMAALGAAVFFFVLYGLTKGRGMGLGDVKFAIPIGLLLGWPNIVVGLMSAFILGAIVGVVLMVMGTKKMKSRIPFGPFLVLGTLIGLLWGNELVMMYMHFL